MRWIANRAAHWALEKGFASGDAIVLDLAQVDDEIWFLEPGSDHFVRFTDEHQSKLNSSEYRL